MSYLCKQIAKIFCPCLLNSKKRDLSSYGDNQFIQKQQFINQIDNEYVIKHQHHQLKKINRKTDEQSTVASYSGSRMIKQTINIDEVQLTTKNQVFSQQNIQNEQDNSLLQSQPMKITDYTDCISSQHPYFQIVYPKLQLLPTLFQIDQKYRLQNSPGSFPLTIYCKQSQVRKTNIFVYQFQFDGISYESYQNLLNNFVLQKSFDTNIDQYYKKLQSPNNDTKLIYLSYHKVLIVAPRDFVYLRYILKKNNQNWSICTSVPNQQETHGKIRGEIILTATRVIQKQGKIYVNVYSEVNMKMGINPEMAKNRGKTQIKKYLEKCHKYLKENQNQSIL